MRERLQNNMSISNYSDVTLGYAYREGCTPPVLGREHLLRMGTIIYADVQIGDFFQTGHYVLIREHCQFGDHVWIGSHSVIDGQVGIGNFVKIAARCYISPQTIIGSRVFIGPGVIITNDKYPLKMRDSYRPAGATLEDNVSVGAGSVILPGVQIGQGAFIAAGSVVTRDVPPMTLAKGNPAVFHELPAKLREKNTALSWKQYLE
ncbi:N-acetyltransferase [Desulfonatronum sp. SC1]|nr:N-acetyltransferase [Desulfonatronum sp. SC1]